MGGKKLEAHQHVNSCCLYVTTGDFSCHLFIFWFLIMVTQCSVMSRTWALGPGRPGRYNYACCVKNFTSLTLSFLTGKIGIIMTR